VAQLMPGLEIAPNANLRSFLTPISVGLGFRPQQQEADELAELMPADRALSAFSDGATVGSVGSYPLRLSVPGGQSVPTAGIAYCGVLPSHRRRGIATELMSRQLADARDRGEPLVALWPSEERIYARYGFGVASSCLALDLDTAHATWRDPEQRRPDIQLLDLDSAHKVIAPIYATARETTAGMAERSDAWWRYRLIRPHDEDSALFVAASEGLGYAIYRHRVPWAESPEGTVEVVEAVGVGAAGTRAIWQYLFDIDLAQEVRAQYLPVDHPLLHMLAEPRRLRARTRDGLWLRILDIPATLSARTRGRSSVVLDVRDEFLADLSGRWYVGADEVARTTKSPDIAVDITDLAAVYLGGATFAQLLRAGRAHELVAGGAARADAALPASVRPWTLEVF
jgi:predicted acetyltransferase